jgi:hypothetical protein
VTDPVCVLDSKPCRGLDQIRYVGIEVPRRLPVGLPVPAQIDRDDAEPGGEPLLGEAPEASAVASDPVQADDGRCSGVTPL